MAKKKKAKSPQPNRELIQLNYDLYQTLRQVRYILDNYSGTVARELILHRLDELKIK